MRAAYVKTHNKVELRDIPVPTPGAGQVLLHIDACGVCGSDFIEATAWAKSWKRFGHEVAATVEEVGLGVQGFTPGDQVGLALSAPCGQCSGCLGGNPRHCSGLITAEQGGFAEKLLVPDVRLLSKAPHPMPFELLVLAEPLTVLLDAFQAAHVQPGDRILVVGGGFLACMAILLAKILQSPPSFCLSRSLHPGLEHCLAAVGGEYFGWNTLAGMTLASPSRLHDRLATLPERVVVLHTPPARYIQHYLMKLPFDSTIVNIGLSPEPKDNVIKLECDQLIFKRMQLISGFPVPCLFLRQAIELLCEHSELFSVLSPASASLEQLADIITGAHKAKKKIMICPSQDGRGEA